MNTPDYGTPLRIEPLIRRIIANNPSHMTLWGTNTYLVGEGDVAVIDPGPDDDAHLAAILAALGPNERITRILITHSHGDHIALVPRLKQATGAEVLGFVAPETPYKPDQALSDGDLIEGDGWTLRTIHTPGHIDDHICFAMGDVLLTGDHIMGWATTVIIPPRGGIADYIRSIEQLATEDWRRLLPAHGDPVDRVAPYLKSLIARRIARREAIIEMLREGPTGPDQVVAKLYRTLPQKLRVAARRNVDAHLIELVDLALAEEIAEDMFRLR